MWWRAPSNHWLQPLLHPPATDLCFVSVPCIVNTRTDQAGDEVILKLTPPQMLNDKRESLLEATAFDQIAQQDRKQRRATAKAAKRSTVVVCYTVVELPTVFGSELTAVVE